MQTEELVNLITELLFSESQLIFKTLEDHFEKDECTQEEELPLDTGHSSLKFV